MTSSSACRFQLAPASGIETAARQRRAHKKPACNRQAKKQEGLPPHDNAEKHNAVCNPVALLLMSVAFAAPAAHAEQPGYKSFQVRFAYDPSDNAPKIYKELGRTAHRACHNPGGTNSIRFNVQAKECRADVVDKVVTAIDRADITALHYGQPRVIIASR
jgi:UrcA family protein